MSDRTRQDMATKLYGTPGGTPGSGGELVAAEEHVDAVARRGGGWLARMGMSPGDKRLAGRLDAGNERIAGELVKAREDVALRTIEAMRQDAAQRLEERAARAAAEREVRLHEIHDVREGHARRTTMDRVDAVQSFETGHVRRADALQAGGELTAEQRAVRDNCLEEVTRGAVIGAMQTHQAGEAIRHETLVATLEGRRRK